MLFIIGLLVTYSIPSRLDFIITYQLMVRLDLVWDELEAVHVAAILVKMDGEDRLAGSSHMVVVASGLCEMLGKGKISEDPILRTIRKSLTKKMNLRKIRQNP